MTFLADSSSTINNVEPGLLGFLVVAVIGFALVVLLRSMNKQFRKIGPKPEDTDAEGASAEGTPTGEASETTSKKPLRGLAAHRAAMAAAAAEADASAAPVAEADAERG